MNLITIKLIFRNFWKNKATSAINIIGFAFSLSICFIIAIYVLHELSYDKSFKNYSKIYRVINAEKNQAQVDHTIKDEILKKIPEIEDYCHLLLRDGKAPIQYKKQVIDINYVASADNNFFKIFSLRVLYGNPLAPFDHNNNSVAISESTSQKLFGNQNPVGEKVVVFNEDEYTVSAVFKDFPERSSIKADIIRNETYEVSKYSESHCENGKCEYKRNIFLILNNQANTDNVTKKINTQLALDDKFLKEVYFQPFKEIYLYDDTHNNPLKKGNLKLIKLLSGIAIIVLLLTCFNYINLSIAQYNKRVKEVGIRKTIGAPRKALITSFLVESIVITVISILIALIITGIAIPFFSSVFDLHINVLGLIKPVHILAMGLFVLFLGLINGFFPAIVISSFRPVNLFRKRFMNLSGNYSVKNILTTIQFAVSITLIVCVITIFKQLSYIKHKDLGFKDSYLLKITTYHITKFDVLKEELLQSPYILNAGYSSGIPGEINWGFGAGLDAENYKDGVSVIGADENLIQTFQFEILDGRNFLNSEKEKACLINETAMKKFGWDSWQGKHFAKWKGNEGMEVVGLIKDFHFGSLHNEIEPIVISFQDHQKSFLSVRLSGSNLVEAMDYIKETWNKIEPNVPIDYTFYDTWFDSMYKKEEQLAKMVSTFAILAIVISCLGIFGQAILNITNRIKEIGVRKVNGAKTGEVVALLNKGFVKWVIIAFFIALPFAWYAMQNWLEEFAYKTELSWWIFALAGILALGIALLTVSWQTWKAARRNPVEALRYE